MAVKGSTRLTEYKRKQIVAAVLEKAGYGKENTEKVRHDLGEIEHKILAALYEKLVPAADRVLIEKLSKPRFEQLTSLNGCFTYQVEEADSRSEMRRVDLIYLDYDRRVSFRGFHSRSVTVLVVNGSILHKLIEKKDFIEENFFGASKELSQNTNRILSTCKTYKQLLTMWPECEELLPDDEPDDNMLPIAIEDLKKLNKAIGVA